MSSKLILKHQIILLPSDCLKNAELKRAVDHYTATMLPIFRRKFQSSQLSSSFVGENFEQSGRQNETTCSKRT